MKWDYPKVLAFALLVVGDKIPAICAETSVGMSGTVEQLILPPPELEAKPVTDPNHVMVVRVVAVYPHGSNYRYDLEYYGLEPGEYDLADYLQAKGDGDLESIPPIPVTVVASLPEGQILPRQLSPVEVPRVGGYKRAILIAGLCWLVGMGFLLFWRRRRPEETPSQEEPALSFEERLRPLVEAALKKNLDPEGYARLERMLLDYWRGRLNLRNAEPLSAMQELKENEEARLLLVKLEEWLHQRGPSLSDDELETLLEPYREEALA